VPGDYTLTLRGRLSLSLSHPPSYLSLTLRGRLSLSLSHPPSYLSLTLHGRLSLSLSHTHPAISPSPCTAGCSWLAATGPSTPPSLRRHCVFLTSDTTAGNRRTSMPTASSVVCGLSTSASCTAFHAAHTSHQPHRRPERNPKPAVYFTQLLQHLLNQLIRQIRPPVLVHRVPQPLRSRARHRSRGRGFVESAARRASVRHRPPARVVVFAPSAALAVVRGVPRPRVAGATHG
jgi:hypothetical protein